MAKFVTLHSVGVHNVGELIEIAKKHEEAGVDIKRLLRLGAIRQATKDDEGEATPYGVAQDVTLASIPPVNAAPNDTGVLPDGSGPVANPDAKPVGDGKAK